MRCLIIRMPFTSGQFFIQGLLVLFAVSSVASMRLVSPRKLGCWGELPVEEKGSR